MEALIFDLTTVGVVCIILAMAVYTTMKFLGKFPGRTIDDVTSYLRPIDLHELESLLDPAQEADFQLRLSCREFRQIQQKRVHLLREHLLRMSHNALVLIEWANLEWAPEQEEQRNEKQNLAHALVEAATELRLCSLLALGKLKLWIIFRTDLWPLLPSPSLPALRNVAGINIMRTYSRLKAAADSLGQWYGAQYRQELTGKL